MSLSARSDRGGAVAIRRPAGSTLLEVMITLAIMALVMGGVLGALAVITTAVGDSRAVMEMTDRIRSAQQRLRQDLAGITAPGLPWLRPEAGQGYLEIIEGPIRDTDYTPEVNGNADTLRNLATNPRDHTKGDADDIIAFTTRSPNEAFTGRYGNTTIDSQVAEVVWFSSWDAATDSDPTSGAALGSPPATAARPTLLFNNTAPNIVATNLSPKYPLLKLYRRVFLVKPELGIIGEQDLALSGLNETVVATRGLDPKLNDISVHRVTKTSTTSSATIQWVANSLGDLTKPQNRSGHAGNLYPPVSAAGTSPIDPSPTPSVAGTGPVAFAMATNRLVPFAGPPRQADGSTTYGTLDTGSRYGEDLVMTNVLAFDIKVWDPQAPVYVTTGPVGTAGTDEFRDRAPKLLKAGQVLVPGDPGYERMLELSLASGGRVPDARGAYVDLYYAYFPNNTATSVNLSGATLGGGLMTSDANLVPPLATDPATKWAQYYSVFAGPGVSVNRQNTTTVYLPPVQSGFNPSFATYDTWSMHYEMAGGLGLTTDGRATNGVDDPPPGGSADGVIDDVGERETSPPYPTPLRGIQIKLRVYEPDSRTVREVTVVESLMQE